MCATSCVHAYEQESSIVAAGTFALRATRRSTVACSLRKRSLICSLVGAIAALVALEQIAAGLAECAVTLVLERADLEEWRLRRHVDVDRDGILGRRADGRDRGREQLADRIRGSRLERGLPADPPEIDLEPEPVELELDI